MDRVAGQIRPSLSLGISEHSGIVNHLVMLCLGIFLNHGVQLGDLLFGVLERGAPLDVCGRDEGAKHRLDLVCLGDLAHGDYVPHCVLEGDISVVAGYVVDPSEDDV